MNAATHLLPMEPLAAYLKALGLANNAAIQVTPLSGGQSNPSFRISAGPGQEYVLRKKPAGVLLASAHAIDREYRVMKALEQTEVPVPRMLHYCESDELLGTPFYLMEFLPGRVFMDQSLPGMTPQQRQDIYRDMNRVIAALHQVDPVQVGLGNYGKVGNYVGRQIARWSRQCLEATIPLPAAMRQLMDWLPEHLPQHEETTLVHGDYRLDNLVFHPTQARVIGLLDWELSTLGHPIADLAYQAMAWRIPPTLWRGIAGLDLAALGIPDEAQYIAWYSSTTGRDTREHWNFYLAYNLFRMAAILHGIAQRAADGNAAAADAEETGAKAGPLAELGLQAAKRHLAELGRPVRI